MKILITGGMGFIGSHLCDLLAKQNHQIILISKSFSKKANLTKTLKNVKIEKLDVTNHSKLGKFLEELKPDVIIHLAGNTSHSASFETPINDIDVNAKSTLFILEKIKQMNKKCKFILGSTFIVIGKPKKLPVNENSICNLSLIHISEPTRPY